MIDFNKRVALAAVSALAAVALTACGSSESSSTTSTAARSEATGSAGSSGSSGEAKGTVDLADDAALGAQILVDAKGRTVYMFEKDDEGDESYCSGACAKAWPPLTSTGAASTGSGLDASQLTTFERDDGSTQLAYAGHPLYYYAGDQAPGDATGNDLDQFGAAWYALDSSGGTVEGGGSSGDSGDDSSSGDSGGASSDDNSRSGYSPY